jgi:hypothetical protein
VGGSLIEGLSELGIQQILLKIAALWGAVFFETKKTADKATQGPEFAEARGAFGGPSFVQELMKLKRLGCLRAGLVIPGREPMK